MAPPIWLDEHGNRRPVRACPRCGQDAPVFRFRVEQLRLLGWRLLATASFVSWCGHAQEFLLLPDSEGGCQLVPVLGEAR